MGQIAYRNEPQRRLSRSCTLLRGAERWIATGIARPAGAQLGGEQRPNLSGYGENAELRGLRGE